MECYKEKGRICEDGTCAMKLYSPKKAAHFVCLDVIKVKYELGLLTREEKEIIRDYRMAN